MTPFGATATGADLAVLREGVGSLLATGRGATQQSYLDRTGAFDRDLWQALVRGGWIALGLPETFGGSDLSVHEQCTVAEAIGAAGVSVPYASTVCALSILAALGDDEDKACWLPRAGAAGVIGALALFEPARPAPQEPSTIWSGGRLSGRKVSVPAGLFADFGLVCASDGCGERVLVCVDLADPKVVRHPLETFDNARGYADLTFDGVACRSLAHDEGPFDQLRARIAILAAFEQIGGAGAAMRQAISYALDRKAFGQPIGRYQAIKHALADLYVLIELARGAAGSALAADPAERLLAAAAARLAASRAYDRAAKEGLQVFAAAGVVWDAPPQIHYRRARSAALEWGGAPYWRGVLMAGLRSQHRATRATP